LLIAAWGGHDAMPTATIVRELGKREYGYLAPGMSEEPRVTTDPDYFEQHPDSVELWSAGSPVFLKPMRWLWERRRPCRNQP
jgi:hypothetical protein